MWHLEKLTARGGMLGTTATNTFEGHRFEREEDLLIRETVQNAKDNPNGGGKPRFVVRLLTLRGAAKAKFLQTAELEALYGNSNLMAKAQSFSELRTLKTSSSLGLIFIEDFNTTGLDGRIDDPMGNWMRFNLHGDAAKLEEQGKIGSFGLGKTVLSRAAGTNTFLVYTAVKPIRSDPSTARLMGHTFQHWYPEGKGQKSGRGWLCKGVNSDEDPIPYTDDEAHQLAESLGFASRREGKTGTSFLLIGTNPGKHRLSIQSIRRAIETWYWPAQLANEIDFELYEDQKRVDDPAPKLRSDLKAYIASKSKLDTGVGDDVHKVTFQPERGKALGNLALTLATDESVFDDPLHPKSPGPRRVARMRAGSGMVTEYKEFGTARRISFAGVYVGSDQVDEVLKYAEPPPHDEWSPVSQRLARVPNGPEIVRAIEERTDKACYSFQQKHSAARAPLTERLPELERLLGIAFEERGPSGGGGGGGGSTNRRTEVDYPGAAGNRPAPKFGASTNQLDFVIRYRLRAGAAAGKVEAWLSVSVAEEATMGKGAPLEVTVTDEVTKKRIYAGPAPAFTFSIKQNQERKFRVTSKAYPKHQVLLFGEGER